MNIIELRQLIHDLPDDMEVEFGAGGEVLFVGANLVVREWNTLYLGVDKEDLTESLIEWELANEGDKDDDEEWPEDREAFMQALAASEDLDPTKAEDSAGCGDVCTIPEPARTGEMWDKKREEEGETTTEMM